MALSFVAGGIAGMSAWASIYPIDVIKTRWQTAELAATTGGAAATAGSSSSSSSSSSLGHVLRTGLRNEGPGFLFQGFSATMMRAAPQHGAVFVVYELVSTWLLGGGE